MFESILETSADSSISFINLLAALGTAFAMGIIISIVYIFTQKNRTPSRSFTLTLVMLPSVVTVIILLVGSNIARAFSLAGAFSIIRFRSAPGDSKDITYVLFTMAIGLATGMGFILYSVVIAVLLCTGMLILEIVKFGQANAKNKILRITVPENIDFENAFDDVIQKYTLSSKLKKVRTADLGSLYEVVYSITEKNGIKIKDFIDELRCRNGNLNIILFLDESLEEL